jgi:C1A family cysteine protease
MPPVWDQGNAGSCTGHGSAAAIAYDRAKDGESPPFTPSRLMLYYDGRAYEGSTSHDAGAMIRDVVKGAANMGVCDENYWPYQLSRLTTQPSSAAYAQAAKHKVSAYYAVSQDINTLKATIAAGYVVVFGFTVYSNFESSAVDHTGLIPMPAGNNIGGHCVCLCGYSSRNYFLFRNSWGTSWGDPDFPGYGWMPAAYVTNPNLASDFWVVKTIAA